MAPDKSYHRRIKSVSADCVGEKDVISMFISQPFPESFCATRRIDMKLPSRGHKKDVCVTVVTVVMDSPECGE